MNRRLNCDSANLDKAVEAAQEQMEAIRRLQAAELLEQLPDKLQETAALRLEYPELSLSELAAEFDPPVSKSCLNHRLRKLLELSQRSCLNNTMLQQERENKLWIGVNRRLRITTRQASTAARAFWRLFRM